MFDGLIAFFSRLLGTSRNASIPAQIPVDQSGAGGAGTSIEPAPVAAPQPLHVSPGNTVSAARQPAAAIVTTGVTMKMTPDQFIAAIGPAAQQLAATTQIPASFTVAQAALESGWASSQLAQKYFNLFGVKADPSWRGPTVTLPTTEYVAGKSVTVNALWRVYDGWLASLQDHAQFLLTNARYKPCFECGNGCAFATAVANAGYATDPQYAQKINSIISAHELLSLDASA